MCQETKQMNPELTNPIMTDLENNYAKPVKMQDPQPDRIW